MDIKIKEELMEAARIIIRANGGDLQSTHFVDTPDRFLRMFEDELSPNGTIVEALEGMVVEESYDQMVVVRDIPIRSFCPHHLLPWFGRAAVGYIPQGSMVGLSKITRAVSAAGRGLKIQEQVTDEIVKAMDEVLNPLGSMCVIEATHLCTLMRGVKSEAQKFTTSTNSGVFRDQPETRAEFMMLFNRGQGMSW